MRFQKTHFLKIVKNLPTGFLQITLLYVFTLHLRKPHILGPFKTVTLNFAMYILAILTCPLNVYVIGIFLKMEISKT